MEKDTTSEKYMSNSQMFVKFAKTGDLNHLVTHVYSQEDPYIQYVSSRSNLAKNALMFFVINNHMQSFENFFNTQFADDIKKEDVLLIFNTLNSQHQEKMYQIIKKHYLNDFSKTELLSMLLSSCSNGNIKLIQEIVEQYNKSYEKLSQSEKMLCVLSSIKQKISTDNSQKLATVKLLEDIFPDLKYHQNDDVLMKTLVEQNNLPLIHYFMYEKKLRITKHLNILAWCNSEFSQIVEKRKVYDSMYQKMKNKEQAHINKPEKIKRLKI